MYPSRFRYSRAASIDDAEKEYASSDDARYLAGGMTLIPTMKLRLAAPTVKQHLGVLEEATLVAVVWHGREKLHYLNPVPLFEVSERWIRSFERARLGALRDLKRTLEEPHE